MKTYAKIEKSGLVSMVTLVTEEKDEAWLKERFGGDWVEASPTAEFRKNSAGVGSSYSSKLDAFIPEKEHKSWVLDENTCIWEAPIPIPTEGSWDWDEQLLNWVEVLPEIAPE